MVGNLGLLGEFEREAIRHRLFFTPLVEITDACNARCAFCYRRESSPVKKTEIPLDVIKRLVRELKKVGAFHVKLTGGEPLCHPDYIEIVKAVREQNLSVRTVSNGILFTKDVIAKVKKHYISTVISLNAIRNDTYASVMGIDGRFLNTAMDNVKRIKDAGLDVAVNFVLNRYNIDEAPEFIEYWENHDIPVLVARVSPSVDGQNSELLATDKQLYQYYHSVDRERIVKHTYDDPNKCLRCNAGYNMGVLAANGDVLACTILRLKIGNFYKDSLSDIWYRNEEILRYRNMVSDPQAESPCFSCDVNPDFSYPLVQG